MNIQGESSKMRHGLGTLGSGWPLWSIWIFHLFGADSIDAYYFTIVMYSGINVILAVSLNLVNGFTGQFSMGHAGFMSIGGYVSAYLTSQVIAANPEWMTHPVFSSILFIFALFAGGLVASGAGYLVGLPSLRLKGDYLAIVTLGFGEIIRVILLNINAVGGARGMPNIPAFHILAGSILLSYCGLHGLAPGPLPMVESSWLSVRRNRRRSHVVNDPR